MTSGFADCALMRYDEKSAVPSGVKIPADTRPAERRAGLDHARFECVAVRVVQV